MRYMSRAALAKGDLVHALSICHLCLVDDWSSKFCNQKNFAKNPDDIRGGARILVHIV